MASKITLHQYDYGQKLIIKITKDGLVEPLDDARVLLKFKNRSTGEKLEPKEMTITDSANAEVEYVFTQKDLAEPATYTCEVETTYKNGEVRLSEDKPFVIVVQTEDYKRTGFLNQMEITD